MFPLIPQIRSGVVPSSSWPPWENPVLGLKTAARCPDKRPCSMWRTWQRNCSARTRWRPWWDTVGGWVLRSERTTSNTLMALSCVCFPSFEWKPVELLSGSSVQYCWMSFSERCVWQQLWKKTDLACCLWSGSNISHHLIPFTLIGSLQKILHSGVLGQR